MADSRSSYGTRGGSSTPTPLPGAPGSLPGATPQSGTGAFGLVPTVPNPIDTQGSAISGNLGNLGSLYGLTGSLNTEIAKQAALPFQLNLPNYGEMTTQSSGNILSLLKGQVPQDVAAQLQQMAAERGISTGSIGSPDSNTALLRALGLTSLGLQQQGEGELSAAISRTPTGQQFNPSQFLVTPQQQQEAQYMANLYAAAPDPSMAGGAALGAARSGLRTGLSTGAGYHPGGGSVPGTTDSLGFPISETGWGGLPADVSYGALGTPSTPSENAGAWNSWMSGLPQSSGGGLEDWEQNLWDTSTPVDYGSNDSLGYGFQTGEPMEGYTGPVWQGGDFTDTSGMFADMGDLGG